MGVPFVVIVECYDTTRPNDGATNRWPMGNPSGGGYAVSDESVTVYVGSNGHYYTGWELDRKLSSGEWRLCVRDRGTDRRLVETATDSLLMLERTSLAALPTWVEARSDGVGVRIVDTRRAIPSG